MNTVLATLKSDEFYNRFAYISNVNAVYSLLSNSAEVAQLRNELSVGLIDDSEIFQFVKACFRDFRTGEIFSHEIAMCAVIIALQSYPSETAEELTRKLAIPVAELQLLSRVSAISLASRSRFSATQSRSFGRYVQTPIVRVEHPATTDAVNTYNELVLT